METTFVVQRRKVHRDALIWVDAAEHDNEDDARKNMDAYVEALGEVLGPFRIVRRTEEVI